MAKKQSKENLISVSDVHEDMMNNDSKYSKAYKELQPKYELISAMVKAKQESGLSQKEIAEIMGTSETALSRLLSGKQSPTISTMSKFAEATGKHLEVRFT